MHYANIYSHNKHFCAVMTAVCPLPNSPTYSLWTRATLLPLFNCFNRQEIVQVKDLSCSHTVTDKGFHKGLPWSSMYKTCERCVSIDLDSFFISSSKGWTPPSARPFEVVRYCASLLELFHFVLWTNAILRKWKDGHYQKLFITFGMAEIPG